MKRKMLQKSVVGYLLLVSLFCFFNLTFASDKLEQLKQAIKEKGANWTAKENWMTNLPPEELQNYYGSILEQPELDQAKVLSLPQLDNLPSHFDWRDNNGNWVTPVKDQNFPNSCSSSGTFSAVAQMESWWKIKNANLDSMIDLSEQFLLSCSDATCGSWQLKGLFNFVDTTGVPTEACFEYQGNDDLPCTNACSNWADEAIQIPGWGWITFGDEHNIDLIKNAIYRHPVTAFHQVYGDFLSYSSGVYEHVYGNHLKNNAILIIGWDDEDQCWICKNSWGEYWGETVNLLPYDVNSGGGGYFRIKWGECQIGKYIPFIWDEKIEEPVLTILPNLIDTELIQGDSLTQDIIFTNVGSKTLEFSTMDFGRMFMFHPDSFKAWDNSSWWCGYKHCNGYENHRLEYLQTPLLNLSSTSEPSLSFMGFWAIEDPAGSEPPWDGWDGCNVWISVDGGVSFTVAHPSSPVYNCQSMTSFGYEFSANMGIGIAGWGGNSGGWKPIDFDLSLYKSDSVLIRFAFASDMGWCTLDDPTLYGFFVDEIIISDGNTIIFEDHGDDSNNMKRIGKRMALGFHDGENPEWISVSNGSGLIPAGESATVEVKVSAKELLPNNNYYGSVAISTNETSGVFSKEIYLNLHVKYPTDVKNDKLKHVIPSKYKLSQNHPNPFNPATKITFLLPEATKAEMKIYNPLGQLIRTFEPINYIAGIHSVEWNGRDDFGRNVASGIYFYNLKATGSKDGSHFSETRKMILIR